MHRLSFWKNDRNQKIEAEMCLPVHSECMLLLNWEILWNFNFFCNLILISPSLPLLLSSYRGWSRGVTAVPEVAERAAPGAPVSHCVGLKMFGGWNITPHFVTPTVYTLSLTPAWVHILLVRIGLCSRSQYSFSFKCARSINFENFNTKS